MPGWLDQVRHAMHHRYVIAGAYRKVLKLNVQDGEVVSFEDHTTGWDSRWPTGSETSIVSVNSDQLFGCSFGAPLEALLKVEGLDEQCDAQGAEDYDLSIRLGRAGYPLFYARRMFTLESEEAHHEEKPFIRVIKKMGSTDSSWVILKKLRAEKRRFTPGNNIYSLRELRLLAEHGKPMPIPKDPRKHWCDGELLSQMPSNNSRK